MKNAFAVFFVLAFAAVVPGQTVSPAPTPPSSEDEVVKISTNLIQLDISITDRDGNPISDIRPDEIEIYENGKRQEISSLSFLSNVSAQTTAKRGSGRRASQIDLPKGPIKPENVHRTIAIVVDDLSLSFGSIYWVKKALKKFVDEEVQPGDLVAIIRTGTGIGALQQFTTDKRMLAAAVSKIKFNTSGSATVASYEPIRPTLMEVVNATRSEGDTRDLSDQINKENAMKSEIDQARQRTFTYGTLGALDYIIRGMKELPGRKSIVLLADGLKMFDREENGVPKISDTMNDLRALIDRANRASVVINTMDARGIIAPGAKADDDTAYRRGEDVENLLRDRERSIGDSRAGLRYLADETGGTAFEQNSLERGLQKIMSDQSYYLVSYIPDDETFDPTIRKFNKLEVKVSRPGVVVRYRSGFFAVAEEESKVDVGTGDGRLLTALISPFATNTLSFSINSLYTPTAGKMYLRTIVYFPNGGLEFRKQPDGRYKAVFDLIALSAGDNGKTSDNVYQTFTVTADDEGIRKYRQHGFVYNFTFPIKKAGGYQIRVAVRDHATDKVGSASQFVQVGNPKKGNLLATSVVVENLTLNSQEKRAAGLKDQADENMDPWTATALREFKAGTVINYMFGVLNAGTDASGNANVQVQTRLYENESPVFTSAVSKVARKPTAGTLDLMGRLNLGSNLPPGDYILQIEITDMLSNRQDRTISQFVQFEIVE